MAYKSEIVAPNDLTVDAYATLARGTNRLQQSTSGQFDTPMLGFFGEAGSLLSAAKKRKRDDLPSDQYYADVAEEVGDFLWYFSRVCDASGVDLSSVVARAAKTTISGSRLTFCSVNEQFALKSRPPLDRLILRLIALAGDVGQFIDWYSHNRKQVAAQALEGHLIPIMRSLFRACSAAGINMEDAAAQNLEKIYDRWPATRGEYPELYDEGHHDLTERLPRKLKIRIEQRTKRGKPYVFQSCRDLNIGDPLTDNIRDPDYYRFHDVFHYAYAAILGWSPVTRALFKLKRKSDAKLDENEDGARAILIEEGLSTMIFNYAKSLRFLEGVARGELSFELLKTVRDFVRGYEVETAPLWLWEEAILAGYKCFRSLKEAKSGLIIVDMDRRLIDIGDLPK